jgi:hypothetical protein
MQLIKWVKLGAIGALLSVTALADHGDNKNNNNNGNNRDGNGSAESSIVGSVPALTIGGVTSAGAPWVAGGEASVSSRGDLEVHVKGLLLGPGAPPALVGTVGPVQMVAASLVCGGSGGAVVDSSDGVPLSSAGNAEIEASINVPSTCMAPVILVRIFNAAGAPGSQLGPFIAVSGFNMSPAKHDHGDNDHE